MIDRIKTLPENKAVRLCIIGVMLLAAIVSVIQGSANAISVSQDFQWDAARAIVDKVDPYELSLNPEMEINDKNLSDFYQIFYDAGLKQKMEANQFPSLLMLLIPYVFMKPLTARYVWLFTNLLYTVGIAVLLKKTFLKSLSDFNYAFVILLMLIGTPYRNQLGVGQHTLFSFFFFLLAVWLDEVKPEGNRILITICLVLSYFKYTLTAPLVLYMLYKKRYLEFAASVVVHVILTVVAAVWMGKSVIYMIIAPLKVSALLSAEGGIDLGALLNGSKMAFVIGGIIGLALMVITFLMPKNRGDILFSLLILWSLVITYHRTYDFFVLSAIAAVFAGSIRSVFSEKIYQYFVIMYYVLIAMVYFGLRVFHENIMSRTVVAIVYYLFTIAITAVAVYIIKKEKKMPESI